MVFDPNYSRRSDLDPFASITENRSSKGHRDAVQYWDTGVIPYRLAVNNPKPVLDAIQIINEKTKWKFQERTQESSYILISEMDVEGCESFLGRSGGVQEMRLHKSCTAGQILHEFMHVLGFVHEHSREDRDDYLSIGWANISEARSDQFQKLPASLSQVASGEFDYESILLYPNHAFSKNGQPTILKRDGQGYPSNRENLSRLDIQKANFLYEKVVKDIGF